MPSTKNDPIKVATVPRDGNPEASPGEASLSCDTASASLAESWVGKDGPYFRSPKKDFPRRQQSQRLELGLTSFVTWSEQLSLSAPHSVRKAGVIAAAQQALRKLWLLQLAS